MTDEPAASAAPLGVGLLFWVSAVAVVGEVAALVVLILSFRQQPNFWSTPPIYLNLVLAGFLAATWAFALRVRVLHPKREASMSVLLAAVAVVTPLLWFGGCALVMA